MNTATVKRATVFVALLFAALLLIPALAYAAVSTSDKTSEDSTWAYQAPTGTVTVNTAGLTPANATITSSPEGAFVLYTDSRDEKDNLNNSLLWVPEGSIDSEGHADSSYTSIPESSTASPEGSVTLTWPGVATLLDGSKADLEMTLSNIFFDKPYKVDPPTGTTERLLDTAAHGPIAVMHSNGFIGPRLLDTAERVGMTCTVNVRIVKDGSPVDGTVLVSTYDLDQGNDTNKQYTEYFNGKYKESFRVDEGDQSDAFIPSDSVLDIDGMKFTSTRSDNNTYKTGFVVLADAGEGMTLTWWGQGNGMGTKLFTGNISHQIKSGTTRGGGIKTTSSGKVGEGDEIGPGQVDVPDGKDQSYLMEPEEGYELGKILIDGEEIDPDDDSTWPDFIEVTKDDNGNPIVTFKENAANHSIYVSWDPIVTATSGEGGAISDPGETTVPGEPVFDDEGNPVYDEDGNIKITPGKKKYTFTPEPGYTIDTVTVNGQEVTPTKNPDGTWSYELEVDEPTDIHVEWKRAFTVTFTDGDHGTSEGGDQTEVPEGDYPEGGNKVTPNKGWVFSGTYTYTITKPDGTVETGTTDDPTSIEVTGDIVFTPQYKPTVVATSGKGGSTTNPGTTVVEMGDKMVFTFTPEPGYTIGPVTVNGQVVTPIDNGDGTWSYVLENITEPMEVHVEWLPIEQMPDTDDPAPLALALAGLAGAALMVARRKVRAQ